MRPAGGMRVPGQSPVARMPGTGRFVPMLGCLPACGSALVGNVARHARQKFQDLQCLAARGGTRRHLYANPHYHSVEGGSGQPLTYEKRVSSSLTAAWLWW